MGKLSLQKFADKQRQQKEPQNHLGIYHVNREKFSQGTDRIGFSPRSARPCSCDGHHRRVHSGLVTSREFREVMISNEQLNLPKNKMRWVGTMAF